MDKKGTTLETAPENKVETRLRRTDNHPGKINRTANKSVRKINVIINRTRHISLGEISRTHPRDSITTMAETIREGIKLGNSRTGESSP